MFLLFVLPMSCPCRLWAWGGVSFDEVLPFQFVWGKTLVSHIFLGPVLCHPLSPSSFSATVEVFDVVLSVEVLPVAHFHFGVCLPHLLWVRLQWLHVWVQYGDHRSYLPPHHQSSWAHSRSLNRDGSVAHRTGSNMLEVNFFCWQARPDRMLGLPHLANIFFSLKCVISTDRSGRCAISMQLEK